MNRDPVSSGSSTCCSELIGLSVQQLTQAQRALRAVQVGVKRDDAHAATSRLVQRSAALGTCGIGRQNASGALI